MDITNEFLKRYDLPVPRYTSYPPATAFTESYTAEDYETAIIESNSAQPQNISIYIHIPYCLQRCHFCGCNAILYPREAMVREYVSCLIEEIERVAPLLDPTRSVTQVSWGGGTPNAISYEYIEQIMDTLRRVFTFSPNAEIAIECSPAYLEHHHIDRLWEIGFTRISLGIQDFHRPVLDAINRKPSRLPIDQLLKHMKEKGFKGVNIDLIYGLPLQTLDSFAENIERILELKPDRLVTFSYAHIPWFNPAQKKMEVYRFPTPEEKLNMLVNTMNTMSASGYRIIGMDHFALPDDDLAIAQEQHQLHRNFQGYSTRKTTGQVYAFGVSGISQLDRAYIQNFKTTPQYIAAIKKGVYPIERGYKMSLSDQVVRDTIGEIMCNGRLDYQTIADQYGITLEEWYKMTAFDPERLEQQVQDGLVDLTDHSISISKEGMLVVRPIAAAYDPRYIPMEGKYSQSV